MDKALAPFASHTYAIMRIVFGLLFVAHGGQKLFGWFGSQPVPLGSLFGVAGLLEIIFGLLITIGLFARYAAFIASGEMAVAYFMSWAPRGFWESFSGPGMEASILFCFLYLFMWAAGPGIWSLDGRFARRATGLAEPVARAS